MATTGDGASAYQSGGAGGKFRKRPNRRSALATPYDRPPIGLRNNNPSLLAKLVDPASRLIYAGADRLFGVFRKRLPALPAQHQPGTSEEPRNRSQEAVTNQHASKNSTIVVEPSTNEGGNLVSISDATEISDLENMLKQKTFTRSEIERLTALLLSKTKESNVVEVNNEKLPSTSYHVPRPDAFTSYTSNKHVEEKEIKNFDTPIVTPIINSRTFEDDGASPADLAKAYMGTRSAKLSPLTIRPSSQPLRQDSMLLTNTSTFLKTPTTSLAPKIATAIMTSGNGSTTFRSRGRSALYNMPRTPYYRGPSTLSQKGVASPSVLEHEGSLSIGSSRMAAKRRSSALDDIGSGGPMRRIRQKASLLSQQNSCSKHTTELGSGQKLLLRNEPDTKGKKAVEETGEISKRNQSYGSVPTESSKMALKIFEQLDRMSPKEKPTGSKLAATAEKIDSTKILSSSKDNRKLEGQNRVLFLDARESTFQSKDTIKENGSKYTVGQSNLLSLPNGSVTVPVSGDEAVATKAGPTTKLAFSMSAHEDSLELDEDNNHSNGHVLFSLGESKKPVTSVLANNDVSTAANAEIVQTPAPSKVGQVALLEPDPVPAKPESKKRAIFPEGSVFNNQKMSFNFPSSTSPSSNTSSSVISQLTSTVNTVTPQNKPTVFPTSETSTLKRIGPSGEKPNISPDAKSLGPTSLISSTKNNDQVQNLASNKDDNGNTQKRVNSFGNSVSSSSANQTAASASGVFSFGGSTNNSSIINGTSSSSPSVFASSSFQSSGANTNKIFNISSSNILSSAATATTVAATTSAASSAISTSLPAPIYSFKSVTTSSTPTSSFASTSFVTSSNGGSIFGLSTSSATLTTNGFQANTQAALTAVTQFASMTSVTSSSTSASSLPSSSAPSFSLTPTVTPTETTSGGSTGGSTTNAFGSGFSSTPGFALSSTVAFSSTPFSFSASSTSTPSAASSPLMFKSSNAGASTGSSIFSFSSNSSSPSPVLGTSSAVNNDHMSMEDTMVDVANQTPSPPLPSFPQPSSGTPGFMFSSTTTQPPVSGTPGFMFNSTATPPPVTPPPMVPFQFSGQTCEPQPQGPQPLSQNTFQPPSGSPFNAGGSFSLGSGGDDKSNRRIVKVKRMNRKK